MKTQAYVSKGKWVTDHLAPINAIMFISTGVLVPVMDIMRPKFPFTQVAFCAVGAVIILVLMKALNVPKRLQIPSGLVLMAVLCSAIFGAGAFASYKYEREGGVLASKVKGLADLQATLLDIKNGKSDDPRVELTNLGIKWDRFALFSAAKQGDLRVVELLLKAKMPLVSDNNSYPSFVVNAKDVPARSEQISLLQNYGYDLRSNAYTEKYGDVKPPSLCSEAFRRENAEGVALLKAEGFCSTEDETWATNNKAPKNIGVNF